MHEEGAFFYLMVFAQETTGTKIPSIMVLFLEASDTCEMPRCRFYIDLTCDLLHLHALGEQLQNLTLSPCDPLLPREGLSFIEKKCHGFLRDNATIFRSLSELSEKGGPSSTALLDFKCPNSRLDWAAVIGSYRL